MAKPVLDKNTQEAMALYYQLMRLPDKDQERMIEVWKEQAPRNIELLQALENNFDSIGETYEKGVETPEDVASLGEAERFFLEDYVTRNDTTDQDGAVLPDEHPEVPTLLRWAVKTATPRKEWADVIKKHMPKGYEVKEIDGEVVLKGPGEKDWRRLDEKGFGWKDIGDVVGDIGQGALIGLGAGAGATLGGLTAATPLAPAAPAISAGGAAIGGGATSYATEFLKEQAASYLNLLDREKDDERAADRMTTAYIDAGLSLIPGGKTITPSMKKFLAKTQVKGVAKDLSKTTIPLGMEGAEKVLYGGQNLARNAADSLREAVSGMNVKAIKLARKYGVDIAKMEKAVKSGADPIIHLVREIRAKTSDSLKTAKDVVVKRRERLLAKSPDIGLSHIRKINELVNNRRDQIIKEHDELYKVDSSNWRLKDYPAHFKEQLKTLDSVQNILPAPDIKTGTIKGKDAALTLRKIQDEINKTPLDKLVGHKQAAQLEAIKIRDAYENMLMDTVPDFKDINTDYRFLKETERQLDSRGFIEKPAEKAARNLEKISGTPERIRPYTDMEIKAREALLKHEPADITNLKQIDDLTRKYRKDLTPDLEDSAMKMQAANYWLDPQRGVVGGPLKGEGRRGFMTNVISHIAGGSTGYAAGGIPGAALGVAAVRSQFSPKGVFRGIQAENALSKFLNSTAMQGVKVTQPVRTGVKSIWEDK